MLYENIRPHACTAEGCRACFVHTSNLKQHIERNHSERGILRRKLREEHVAKFLTAAGIAFDRELIVDFRLEASKKLARSTLSSTRPIASLRSSATKIRTKLTRCDAT
jgi:hypothetical protein